MTRTITTLLDQPLGPCLNYAIWCEQDRRLLGIFSPPPNSRFQMFSLDSTPGKLWERAIPDFLSAGRPVRPPR
jgi:hypothetical protein